MTHLWGEAIDVRLRTRSKSPAANPQDIHSIKTRTSACCKNDLLHTNSQGPPFRIWPSILGANIVFATAQLQRILSSPLRLDIARNLFDCGLQWRHLICRAHMVDVMAVLKWPLLALAVATLFGCSGSGNGLYAPLPKTSTAWNGADRPARVRTEGQAVRSTRILRPKTETMVGSINYRTPDPALKPYSKEWLAQQEAIDREAEAALAKKMTICRGCQSPPKVLDLVARPPVHSVETPAKDYEATGSIRPLVP